MTDTPSFRSRPTISFLRGASHPEELFAQAKLLGLPALGITDRNSLAGIVRVPSARRGSRRAHDRRLPPRSHRRHRRCWSIRTDRPAYARLCRLLTLGKGRAGKGDCDLAWQDVAAHGDGLIAHAAARPAGRCAASLAGAAARAISATVPISR